MKSTALQSPPEWVNYKYYELQSTCKSRTLRYKSHGPLYYLKEGLKAVLTLTAIYFLIVLLALL